MPSVDPVPLLTPSTASMIAVSNELSLAQSCLTHKEPLLSEKRASLPVHTISSLAVCYAFSVVLACLAGLGLWGWSVADYVRCSITANGCDADTLPGHGQTYGAAHLLGLAAFVVLAPGALVLFLVVSGCADECPPHSHA